MGTEQDFCCFLFVFVFLFFFVVTLNVVNFEIGVYDKELQFMCVLRPAVPGHKYAGRGVRAQQLHGAASGHWRRQQTLAL